MRIRKISQSTPIKAKVVNSYSESEEETYSCDYINNTKANSSDVYTKTETDTRLNKKQDKLTAGTGIGITGTNIINNLNANYSTDEQVIGKWTDGKPLYRKVVEIGSLPNNKAQTYNHNISNMDMLTYYDLIWYDTEDNLFLKAPRIDNLEVFVKCEINTTNIQIEAKGLDWSNRTQNAKVVLEYTKTTD